MVRDKGQQKTDLAVKRAEWRLSRAYRHAQQDIDRKLKDWREGHAAREQQLQQLVDAGKMSQEDFDAWKRGQVFQDRQWQQKAEQIRQTLLQADQEAMKIVRDGKIDVFTTNANFMVERIGEHTASASFELYDTHTVTRLLQRDPMMLPKLPPEKAILKDKAYTYYNKLVNGAITQGIIQGETVQQIARRIAEETGEGCYKSALRNARTAYTGAQNAGRIEGMHQAQRLGINVQKKWLSAHDGHTRDAHIHLDGQVQDVDEPFESDLGEIMYPGDPAALPANVYNCRCTLIEVFPEYDAGANQPSNERFQSYERDEHDNEYDHLLERWREAQQQESEAGNDPQDWLRFRQERQKIERDIRTNFGIEETAATAQKSNVKYVPLKRRNTEFNEADVIARIGGGDLTKGSCASLGFCYAGQKAGYDVLDFRDGESRYIFSTHCVKVLETLQSDGLTTIVGEARSYGVSGKRALAQMVEGKQYYFECGSHAAIVRKLDGKLDYLELQSSKQNGWQPFSKYGVDKTLSWRFGASKSGAGMTVRSYAVDVDEMAKSDRFMKMMGYINTDESAQRKGAAGHER